MGLELTKRIKDNIIERRNRLFSNSLNYYNSFKGFKLNTLTFLFILKPY